MSEAPKIPPVRYPEATAPDDSRPPTAGPAEVDAARAPAIAFIRSRRLSGRFVQIGAGSGSFTRQLIAECGAESILAVEPSDLRARNFTRTIAGSPALPAEVWLHTGAVSSLPDAWLNPHDTDPDRGGVYLSAVRIRRESRPVRPTTVDGLCRGFPSVALLCVNVDHHELEVMTSAFAALRRLRPELYIETTGETQPELTRLLRGAGYASVHVFKNAARYYIHVGMPALLGLACLRRIPGPSGHKLRLSLTAHMMTRSRNRLTTRPLSTGSFPAGASRVL